MGRPVDFALAAYDATAKEGDAFALACIVAKSVGYGAWLAVDMLQWLSSARVIELSAAASIALASVSPRLWLLGIASSLALGLHRVQMLSVRRRRLALTSAADPEAMRELQKEADALSTSVVCDALDMLIPLTAMGYLPLSPGVVGLAGTITSVLGGIAIYPSSN